MRTSNAFRTLLCALLALVAVLAVAAPANASSRQLSLIQDDAELFGERGEDPAAAMREMRDLGVDVIRTNVLFYRIYSRQQDRVKPAGFDTSDPNEPLYNWFATDRIVSLAEANGIKVMFTVSGPGPRWFSEKPSRCGSKPCTYRPKASEFGQFVAAVAKRYRGRVDWYSIYNEPNLEQWITPEITNTRYGRVETAAIYYRKLWTEGYKAIRTYDPARRNRVLFGEVAAISAPVPFL
jgi:GH35 family endo-1,4-beta-xylanase